MTFVSKFTIKIAGWNGWFEEISKLKWFFENEIETLSLVNRVVSFCEHIFIKIPAGSWSCFMGISPLSHTKWSKISITVLGTSGFLGFPDFKLKYVNLNYDTFLEELLRFWFFYRLFFVFFCWMSVNSVANNVIRFFTI